MADEVPHEKIVCAIASLLASKDTAYVEHVKKRAADGNLKIKGRYINEETVVEAISRLASKENEPGLAKDNGNGGLRWMPSAASAAALASKVIEECEEAELYQGRVQVVGGNKLAVLVKPDVTSAATGDYLPADEWADTIARMVNRKDGRVYVRLRCFNGWVSSRSRKDYAKVVLRGEEGKPPLEPMSAEVIGRSRAMRLLPAMTEDGRLADGGKASERRFRTTLTVPLLKHPDFSGANASKLNPKEEFLADGAFLRAADGRAYLHLKDQRGWVCERARADFSKLAVEPCGFVDDFEEEPAKDSRSRTREGSKKVFVVEKVVEKDVVEAATQPGEAKAPESAAVFRSDYEILPKELHPPKPILRSLRSKLWSLYRSHGLRVKDCEEDLKEVKEKASSFARACPAQKELLQYAEALQKEAKKAQAAWTDAVKSLLKDSPRHESSAPVPSAGSGSVSPVQVRGGRWFCAMLREGDDTGSWRPCGPLRSTSQEASDDLAKLLKAKDAREKRKAEEEGQEPEAKRQKS